MDGRNVSGKLLDDTLVVPQELLLHKFLANSFVANSQGVYLDELKRIEFNGKILLKIVLKGDLLSPLIICSETFL